jgi:6-phosphofructokinase 1
VEACLAGAYNVMVALSSGEIVRIPIEEVAGKPHQVPLDSDLIRAGRNLGISFGD